MRIEIDPYRWRLSGSFLAHLFKATTRQHHRAVAATIMRLVPPALVVFDVGAHAGQYTKLFAIAAVEGRVYAVEPGSYARSILRSVVWLHGLANVAVLPIALGSGSELGTLTLPVKSRGGLGFGLAHLGTPGNAGTSRARDCRPDHPRRRRRRTPARSTRFHQSRYRRLGSALLHGAGTVCDDFGHA